MFRTRSQKRVANNLDLTPMVDVTFLLLIFFMITALFTLQKAMAHPPKHQTGENSQQPTSDDLSIQMQIDELNHVRVEGKLAETTEEIARAISSEMARQACTSLLVIAHPDSRHEYAIRVYDAAQEAKVQKIRQQLAEYI